MVREISSDRRICIYPRRRPLGQKTGLTSLLVHQEEDNGSGQRQDFW